MAWLRRSDGTDGGLLRRPLLALLIFLGDVGRDGGAGGEGGDGDLCIGSRWLADWSGLSAISLEGGDAGENGVKPVDLCGT